ncbi:hypothetical protein Pmani_034019 [Petrolisthes manimaculis]|uniref:Uncharacterized protein n=1 Tax=Petrolisthes manimaculis TaxID=1843537 RepID=A0AAE1TQ47_9EUCA|nr:hypothetical protein Pmani_034019 [Petrolisthes manimaculis]
MEYVQKKLKAHERAPSCEAQLQLLDSFHTFKPALRIQGFILTRHQVPPTNASHTSVHHASVGEQQQRKIFTVLWF